MSDKKYDILAIGSPIVDILVKTNDDFLNSLGFEKGSMNLLDNEKAKLLFDYLATIKNKDEIESITEMSGGTAANVAANISQLGAKSAFIGKIGNDDMGKVFSTKLQENNVEFVTKPLEKDLMTGRSLVIVTKDGQRTMCTFPGASYDIEESDIDEEMIKSAKMLFISGYSLGNDNLSKIVNSMVDIARQNNVKIAFDLSDSSIVKQKKDVFLEWIIKNADIIFAEKEEFIALFGTGDMEKITTSITEICKTSEKIFITTCWSNGIIIQQNENKIDIASPNSDGLIDITGAGASFISGFLYGYLNDKSLDESASIAIKIVESVFKQLGARPENIKDLL